MPSIGLKRLKQIIREELSNINEGPDEDAATKVMSAASKLLKSLESFKETSSEKAKAELTSHLEGLEKTLKRIVASPMTYVDSTQPTEKKVTLKPEKKDLV